MIKYTIPQGEGVGGRIRAEYQTYMSEGKGEGKCSSGLSFEPVLSDGDERDAKGKHG